MLNVGMTELLCFAISALLVLGPEKLPEAARFAPGTAQTRPASKLARFQAAFRRSIGNRPAPTRSARQKPPGFAPLLEPPSE